MKLQQLDQNSSNYMILRVVLRMQVPE